jgi:hypothetical protein
MFAVSIYGLERCPGASKESQEDFKWKYDVAQIVAYGTVSNVQKNTATLQVSCTLKGQLPVSTVELTQLEDVMNLTECHYLTANKQYIVFLESMKTAGVDSKILYRLANMEEIEINSNSVNAFLEEECADEDDYGIEMTIFYFNNNLKCSQFTATCNQATKTSIQALNYPPLTKSTTFLGGFKKTLAVPTMKDEAISGKQIGGTGDEQFRSSAMIATICMPLMVFLVGLMMKFSF